MPNALHYLLVVRLKEEVGIREDNYLLWTSLFPRGFDVADTRAKATNMGKRRYDQLLSDFAAEWADDPEKCDFVEAAARIASRTRRGRQVPEDDLCRLVRMSGGERELVELRTQLERCEERYRQGVRNRTELCRPLAGRCRREEGSADVRAALERLFRAMGASDDELAAAREQAFDDLACLLVRDPAKAQLVAAVRESVARQSVRIDGHDVDSVLGRTLVQHASDPWNGGAGDEPNDYRGLGFLFSADFRESFDAMLRREFGWQDNQLFARFWQEYLFLQERYLSGMCDASEEVDIVVALLTMCVLACLVGPGSFVEELGFSLPDTVKTALRLGGSGMGLRKSQRYQLQPVVFNGHDARTYYTSSEEAIVFDVDDVVRFGRDSSWMSEIVCKSVVFSDIDVSRRHAELRHTPKGWEIVDVGDGHGSANGTLVFRAFGGPIFRKRGFSDAERAIKIQSGDIIYIAPPEGGHYDVEHRRGKVVPEVGKEHRAFRFERCG